ncbi:MAG: hypothetical protein J7J96_00375 [Sulfurimonas sp.]|nr:hypothetical protein [Sulfurimonas sp.]
MRIFAWLLGTVIGLAIFAIGGAYFVAFTSGGNAILQPIIQEKINEQTKLNTKLTTFSLTTDEFEIFLELDSFNTIHAKGNYSLSTQAFNVAYKLKLEKIETLKSLTNAPLKGAFRTEGNVKGDMKFMEIDGISDVASSDTSYHVELTDLNPTSIIAKIKDADLVALLELGGQKPYAKAKVDVDVDFKNITPHALDGGIVLTTKNGVLNTPLMNKDFNLTIPKTDFNMNLDAKLKGDDVDYTYALNSNLAKITSSGKVIPEPLKMDIIYGVDVKELAVLKPITKADVRGAFRLNGTVKGTRANMIVDGKSDFASSDTKFTAKLKDFEPASLKATMKNLKLAKVLYMVKQPHYADGVFDLDVDIIDLKSGELKGTVVSNVKKGLIDSKYMTKAYEFKSHMPRTSFTLATNTKLNGDIADTKVNLKSSLANFDIKQARVNLKDNSIVSDYITTIPNLDKLYFVTQRHLKGSLSANGELKKGKDLDLTMHSKVAGGDVDVKLHNDDLRADLKSIQTLDALKMLIYPEVFKSSLNGVLDYNIAEQKGKFNGDLVDGFFTQNQVLTLVKQYAKIDLYKQKFKGIVSADINKKKILASLDLKSNTSSITTKNTKLNSKTQKINSKIDIVANKHPIYVTLTGNTASPKVKIDAGEILKEKAKEKLKKKLGDKLGGDVGNLLKGLF